MICAVIRSLCAVVVFGVTAVAPSHAQSNVNWSRFGLQDVAATAECASRQMPSLHAMDVVMTYWGPPVMTGGSCRSSRSTVTPEVVSRARGSLLPALSSCVGYRVERDDTAYVQRVGYATAVIAASGLYSFESGKSRLDEYIERTRACEPR